MTVGIIGYGNMGAALATGIQETRPDVRLAILEIAPARRKWAVQKLNAVDCGTDAGKLCEVSDVVVLAVPPMEFGPLAAGLVKHIGDRVVISLLAYVTLEQLVEGLQTRNVCRFMPNIAAEVGQALIGLAYPENPSEALVAASSDLAKAVGMPLCVSEALIPAINGLSGSGIAFLLKFIHGACLGAVETGMRYQDALTAMLQVLRGTTALLDQGGEHPIELVSKVTTPGGATIAGVRELDMHGFEGIVEAGVIASASRALETEH